MVRDRADAVASSSFEIGEIELGRLTFDLFAALRMRAAIMSDPDEQKHAALHYILEAWEEALHDGVEPEMLANAAMFAALSDLVSAYGENAVSEMTKGLSRRIEHGEFTLHRTTQ